MKTSAENRLRSRLEAWRQTASRDEGTDGVEGPMTEAELRAEVLRLRAEVAALRHELLSARKPPVILPVSVVEDGPALDRGTRPPPYPDREPADGGAAVHSVRGPDLRPLERKYRVRLLLRDLQRDLDAAQDPFQNLKVWRRFLERARGMQDLAELLAPFRKDREKLKDRAARGVFLEELRKLADLEGELQALFDGAPKESP